MSTTNGVVLPIPELTDTADGPDAISKLANATEDYFYDRILPAGVSRYLPYHWGQGVTLPTAANGVKVGDTFTHTGLACVLRAIDPTATTPVWRQITMSEVANLAARDAISTNYAALLHQGFRVRQIDVNVIWEWTGSYWDAKTLVRGKIWRTASFSASLTANTRYGVGLQQSRLTGGFTWGGGDNSTGASSYLQLPFDGLFDLEASGYISGGNTAAIAAIVRRVRAAAADADVTLVNTWKGNASVDQMVQTVHTSVPLKAADKLFLDTIVYGVSGLAFYGTNEAHMHLTATLVGPLGANVPL